MTRFVFSRLFFAAAAVLTAVAAGPVFAGATHDAGVPICQEAVFTLMARDYGIVPGKVPQADAMARLLKDLRAKAQAVEGRVVLRFDAGIYPVPESSCQKRVLFISNHDQGTDGVPTLGERRVFLPLENLPPSVTIEAQGVTFELDGRIIPVTAERCESLTLIGLTVDYKTPTITQVTFEKVDAGARTVTFRPIAGTQPVMRGNRLAFRGPGWEETPWGGILFEANGRIAYRTSDCRFPLENVTDNRDGTYTARNAAHGAFKVGQHMALRGWKRPAPGIVLSESKNVMLKDVTVHFADGMGLLAQNTENMTLKGFRVVPNRAKGRVFSTQADATHFSGCSGRIVSVEGYYSGMMDDAINVHGTYLRVQKRLDDRTLECAYMHYQAYGFDWGGFGDRVTFVRSRTMENIASSDNRVVSCQPLDGRPVANAVPGAKRFRLTFEKPLPAEINPANVQLGIENLTRTPSVYFRGNRIEDNRARGALFSTPKRVVCEYNVFDHVSGSAILLCGDCNGWFETGACTDVVIRKNTFINCLTSPFQFTEAVVSICPEIPELHHQKIPLHSNIVIEDNDFVTFDTPLVFAKSVDGLTVRNNTLLRTHDYAPYMGGRKWLELRNCRNVKAEEPRL